MDKELVISKLRKSGLGVTQPRIAILSYLMENHIHPTIDTIYASLHDSCPSLSRTTVYNSVRQMTERGLLKTLVIDESHVHVDENTSPHSHLLCKRCGCIVDLPISGSDDEKSGRPFMIGGNLIEEVHQYYRGLCSDCAAVKEENSL